jgi:phage shock protein E
VTACSWPEKTDAIDRMERAMTVQAKFSNHPRGIFVPLLVSLLMVSVGRINADDRNDEPREHTTDSLETVRGRIDEKKAVLVDVRDLVEWNAGHVQGAKHLPWRDLQDKLKEEDVAKKISKDLIVYTHCAVGYRALRAAKILKKYGYDVRALKPGYEELVKAGFPSQKED